MNDKVYFSMAEVMAQLGWTRDKVRHLTTFLHVKPTKLPNREVRYTTEQIDWLRRGDALAKASKPANWEAIAVEIGSLHPVDASPAAATDDLFAGLGAGSAPLEPEPVAAKPRLAPPDPFDEAGDPKSSTEKMRDVADAWEEGTPPEPRFRMPPRPVGSIIASRPFESGRGQPDPHHNLPAGERNNLGDLGELGKTPLSPLPHRYEQFPGDPVESFGFQAVSIRYPVVTIDFRENVSLDRTVSQSQLDRILDILNED